MSEIRAHELKCWPEFFHPLRRGAKPFELRKNDRDYQVGDYLLIREFDPMYGGNYTGRKEYRKVVYALTHEQAPDGLKEGFAILVLRPVNEDEIEPIDAALWNKHKAPAEAAS